MRKRQAGLRRGTALFHPTLYAVDSQGDLPSGGNLLPLPNRLLVKNGTALAHGQFGLVFTTIGLYDNNH